MERQEYTKYIIEAFGTNGLANVIDDYKASKLYDLYIALVDTNKHTNLTAITEEKDVILKHFIDSASVCEFFDDGSTVIDVGCGAGFPSLPLAILRPDLTITAIDSTGKKVNYVNTTAEKLGLTNITAVCTRAEDFAKERRESFDACTSRAVARLNVLSELCIPFVKICGRFVAMKSDKGVEEFDEARKGISTLGCDLESKKEMTFLLEGNSIQREIYVFKKQRKTPPLYPRNYSQITKKPL